MVDSLRVGRIYKFHGRYLRITQIVPVGKDKDGYLHLEDARSGRPFPFFYYGFFFKKDAEHAPRIIDALLSEI